MSVDYVDLELFSYLKKKQMVPISDYRDVIYFCIILIDNFCKMMTSELLTCNFARQRDNQSRIIKDNSGKDGILVHLQLLILV